MMSGNKTNNGKVSIVGAGLVGTLLSILLARTEGLIVEVFERRSDPRNAGKAEGRSINLAISTRGLHALGKIGIAQEVLKEAIPMRGRMIHSIEGEQNFQRYGRDDSQTINSISRFGLNLFLLKHASHQYDVQFHFNRKLVGVDFENSLLQFVDSKTKEKHTIQSKIMIGADGSSSRMRKEMQKTLKFKFDEIDSGAAYKELTIDPGKNGQHKMEKNALHIWPRKSFMLIALPNFDGSYTCTLFLPQKGPVSFEALQTPREVEKFFETHFSDTVSLISDLSQTFFENPTGKLLTLKGFPWVSPQKNAALIGDAAHAIIPFFGQGMNCGFEDCCVLEDILSESGKIKGQEIGWGEIFSRYEHLRKPKTDAIARMSIENFVEMRDHVGDPRFLLQKNVEKILEEKFPKQYVSRYCMVSFSTVPYDKAYAIGEVQKEILNELCQNIQVEKDLDLNKAEQLIRDKLVPFIEHYERG